MNLKSIFTLLLAAAGSLTSTAQTYGAMPPQAAVSLDSCRAMALRSNKQLMISRERMNTAHYQNKEAFAAYLPAIDFTGGYAYNQRQIALLGEDAMLPTKTFDLATQSYQYNIVKNPVTGEPVLNNGSPIPSEVAVIPKDAMTFDTHNVFFGALTLTQPIYMGGKIVAMNKLTKFAEQLAGQLNIREAENVVYAVDAAYWQVVSLKAKHELAKSYVNLLDTLQRNVRMMVENGVATKSDQLSVDVKLNSAQVDLVKVENGLKLSRMALAQVCGLPVDTTFPLVDEDADISDVCASPEALGGYNMEEVYDRRPDIRALELASDIAGQQKNVARASMLPNLALIGAYSFSNPNLNDGFKKKFGGGFSVGVALTVPIWHWGGNYAKYKAAESAQVISRLQLADARDMVELQVNQALQQTQEAYTTYEMTSVNLKKADENLRTATLAYKEGVATPNNVMEAQTAWLKAHSEQIDAMVGVRLCDTYLRKALGTLAY
ncbi:MAG: TolC family protein [Muribaculaceae bacterium]|nr:TolC family protein [Muribaculaceae bacterium]